MKNISGIKAVFNLIGYKAEVPDMYLVVSIQKVETADGTEGWMMSTEKYVKSAVENFELKLVKSNCRLPFRYDTPMNTIYHPSEDTTKEMNSEGLKLYQEVNRHPTLGIRYCNGRHTPRSILALVPTGVATFGTSTGHINSVWVSSASSQALAVF